VITDLVMGANAMTAKEDLISRPPELAGPTELLGSTAFQDIVEFRRSVWAQQEWLDTT
jgi:hypothetical protein